MFELRAASVADTHAIAASLAGVCRAGDLIVLAGEMGSGKTAFAQGFGRALGVVEPMTSPTFTLVHSHAVPASRGNSKLTLHHADLYRLERTVEVADLALDELAEFGGIVLVEWGDVVEGAFDDHAAVHLRFETDDPVGADFDENVRLIEISGVGPTWANRWARLGDLVEAYRC